MDLYKVKYIDNYITQHLYVVATDESHARKKVLLSEVKYVVIIKIKVVNQLFIK